MEATTDFVNKYEKGKIYKLCCKDANITEIYIGSTVNHYRRKCHHKHRCNNPNSKNYNLYVYQFIRENGGFENWDLVILEEYSAQNKGELSWKEREWIERLKPSLNSVKRPAITTEEIRELQKKWRENNPEQIRELQKKWRENNPEQIREYSKKYYEENLEEYRKRNRKYRENNPEQIRESSRKYRENNPEQIREYQKIYRENNKQKINEKRRERVNCDICNKELARGSLTAHKKRIHNN